MSFLALQYVHPTSGHLPVTQDVSENLVGVVERWEGYVSIEGEREWYRLGGGEAPRAVPEPIFRYEAKYFTNY